MKKRTWLLWMLVLVTSVVFMSGGCGGGGGGGGGTPETPGTSQGVPVINQIEFSGTNNTTLRITGENFKDTLGVSLNSDIALLIDNSNGRDDFIEVQLPSTAGNGSLILKNKKGSSEPIDVVIPRSIPGRVIFPDVGISNTEPFHVYWSIFEKEITPSNFTMPVGNGDISIPVLFKGDSKEIAMLSLVTPKDTEIVFSAKSTATALVWLSMGAFLDDEYCIEKIDLLYNNSDLASLETKIIDNWRNSGTYSSIYSNNEIISLTASIADDFFVSLSAEEGMFYSIKSVMPLKDEVKRVYPDKILNINGAGIVDCKATEHIGQFEIINRSWLPLTFQVKTVTGQIVQNPTLLLGGRALFPSDSLYAFDMFLAPTVNNDYEIEIIVGSSGTKTINNWKPDMTPERTKIHTSLVMLDVNATQLSFLQCVVGLSKIDFWGTLGGGIDADTPVGQLAAIIDNLPPEVFASLKKAIYPDTLLPILDGKSLFQTFSESLNNFGSYKSTVKENLSPLIIFEGKHIRPQIEPDTLSLSPTQTSQLTVTYNGQNVTPSYWVSENENVATVNSNGLVTAVRIGSTRISATVDNQIAYCDVHVIDDGSLSGNWEILSGEMVEYLAATNYTYIHELRFDSSKGSPIKTLQISPDPSGEYKLSVGGDTYWGIWYWYYDEQPEFSSYHELRPFFDELTHADFPTYEKISANLYSKTKESSGSNPAHRYEEKVWNEFQGDTWKMCLTQDGYYAEGHAKEGQIVQTRRGTIILQKKN